MQQTSEIFRCLSGSRMYGTDLPDSDTDYKAVHVPSRREILLGQGKEHINTSTGSNASSNSKADVDLESIRLQRFLQLAGGMQPLAVEMLFAHPMRAVHPLWQHIVDNRDVLINAQAGPFTGYCRAQANRYAVRGDRLEAFTKVCQCLWRFAPGSKGTDNAHLLELLADIDNVTVIDKANPGGVMIPTLVVFGRQMGLTCAVKEIYKVMHRPIDDAGKRSKDAHAAGGADWKAMYHAVRIAQEGSDLFTKGELVFPSPDKALLLSIRKGELPLEKVMDIFEDKMIQMEDAVITTSLRPKPDHKWMDDLVMETNSEIIKNTG